MAGSFLSAGRGIPILYKIMISKGRDISFLSDDKHLFLYYNREWL